MTRKTALMLLHINEALSSYAPGSVLPEASTDSVLTHLTPLVGRASAKKLVTAFGAHGVARREAEEIAHEAEVSLTVARRVVAARELGEVLGRTPTKLTSSKEVSTALPLGYARYEREVMTALVLNNQLERIAIILIAVGGANVICLSAADVLRPILRFGGSAFILVHNHPSGSPEPSEADVLFTNRIAKAAWFLGLRLLDHIIIAERGSVSFLDTGLLLSEEELEGGAS